MGLDQFAGSDVTGPGHRAPGVLDHPGKGVPKPDGDVPDGAEGEDARTRPGTREGANGDDADREDVEGAARG